MFNKGEYIIYGTNGVCKVADISVIDMEGALKDRLYYILEPYGANGGKIFTPVDSEKTLMRRISSKAEADNLLEGILDINVLETGNDKQREGIYKEALRTCDCKELFRIIKTVSLYRKERLSLGKKLNAVDEKYLKKAEDNLYSELSIPFGIPKEGMEELIADRMRMGQYS